MKPSIRKGKEMEQLKRTKRNPDPIIPIVYWDEVMPSKSYRNKIYVFIEHGTNDIYIIVRPRRSYCWMKLSNPLDTTKAKYRSGMHNFMNWTSDVPDLIERSLHHGINVYIFDSIQDLFCSHKRHHMITSKMPIK